MGKRRSIYRGAKNVAFYLENLMQRLSGVEKKIYMIVLPQALVVIKIYIYTHYGLSTLQSSLNYMLVC